MGTAEVVCELKRYNEKGKLEYLLTFDSQRKDEKFYDKDGNIYYEIIMKTINYAAGQERESWIGYHKNGKVRRESITVWDGNEEDLISSKTERIYSINGDLKKESKK